MKETTYKPHDAKIIPNFSNKTFEGAKQWWREMLALGLYINPEDGAENYVDSKTGEQALSVEAIVKVNSIYEEMFNILGEEKTLDAGTTEWWMFQGYTWDEQGEEWVEAKHSTLKLG